MSGADPALDTLEAFESSAEFDWSHPEADPSHPRYEPPHLRHQPGDSWQIGGKPFDPDDRGPYGNPLWRPDTRTGRHRRGELPDPLPPEPEPSPPVEDRRPAPGPRRRRFWTETGQDRQAPQEGYRFDRLREDAWDDFMTDSAPLAAAHHTRPVRRSRQTALDREGGLALMMWVRLAQWLFAVLRSLTAGAGPGAESRRTAGPALVSGHVRPPAARKRRSRLARLRTGKEQTCAANTGQGSVLSGSAAAPQPEACSGPETSQTSPDRPGQARPDSDRSRPGQARPDLGRSMPGRAAAAFFSGAARARSGVASWA